MADLVRFIRTLVYSDTSALGRTLFTQHEQDHLFRVTMNSLSSKAFLDSLSHVTSQLFTWFRQVQDEVPCTPASNHAAAASPEEAPIRRLHGRARLAIVFFITCAFRATSQQLTTMGLLSGPGALAAQKPFPSLLPDETTGGGGGAAPPADPRPLAPGEPMAGSKPKGAKPVRRVGGDARTMAGCLREEVAYGQLAPLLDTVCSFLLETVEWLVEVPPRETDATFSRLFDAGSPFLVRLSASAADVTVVQPLAGAPCSPVVLAQPFDAPFNTASTVPWPFRDLFHATMDCLGSVRSMLHIRRVQSTVLHRVVSLRALIDAETQPGDDDAVNPPPPPPLPPGSAQAQPQSPARPGRHEAPAYARRIVVYGAVLGALGSQFASAIAARFLLHSELAAPAPADARAGEAPFDWTSTKQLLAEVAALLVKIHEAALGNGLLIDYDVPTVRKTYLFADCYDGAASTYLATPSDAVVFDALFFLVASFLLPLRMVCRHFGEAHGRAAYDFGSLVQMSEPLRRALAYLAQRNAFRASEDAEPAAPSPCPFHYYDLFCALTAFRADLPGGREGDAPDPPDADSDQPLSSARRLLLRQRACAGGEEGPALSSALSRRLAQELPRSAGAAGGDAAEIDAAIAQLSRECTRQDTLDRLAAAGPTSPAGEADDCLAEVESMHSESGASLLALGVPGANYPSVLLASFFVQSLSFLPVIPPVFLADCLRLPGAVLHVGDFFAQSLNSAFSASYIADFLTMASSMDLAVSHHPGAGLGAAPTPGSAQAARAPLNETRAWVAVCRGFVLALTSICCERCLTPFVAGSLGFSDLQFSHSASCTRNAFFPSITYTAVPPCAQDGAPDWQEFHDSVCQLFFEVCELFRAHHRGVSFMQIMFYLYKGCADSGHAALASALAHGLLAVLARTRYLLARPSFVSYLDVCQLLAMVVGGGGCDALPLTLTRFAGLSPLCRLAALDAMASVATGTAGCRSLVASHCFTSLAGEEYEVRRATPIKQRLAPSSALAPYFCATYECVPHWKRDDASQACALDASGGPAGDAAQAAQAAQAGGAAPAPPCPAGPAIPAGLAGTVAHENFVSRVMDYLMTETPFFFDNFSDVAELNETIAEMTRLTEAGDGGPAADAPPPAGDSASRLVSNDRFILQLMIELRDRLSAGRGASERAASVTFCPARPFSFLAGDCLRTLAVLAALSAAVEACSPCSCSSPSQLSAALRATTDSGSEFNKLQDAVSLCGAVPLAHDAVIEAVVTAGWLCAYLAGVATAWRPETRLLGALRELSSGATQKLACVSASSTEAQFSRLVCGDPHPSGHAGGCSAAGQVQGLWRPSLSQHDAAVLHAGDGDGSVDPYTTPDASDLVDVAPHAGGRSAETGLSANLLRHRFYLAMDRHILLRYIVLTLLNRFSSHDCLHDTEVLLNIAVAPDPITKALSCEAVSPLDKASLPVVFGIGLGRPAPASTDSVHGEGRGAFEVSTLHVLRNSLRCLANDVFTRAYVPKHVGDALQLCKPFIERDNSLVHNTCLGLGSDLLCSDSIHSLRNLARLANAVLLSGFALPSIYLLDSDAVSSLVLYVFGPAGSPHGMPDLDWEDAALDCPLPAEGAQPDAGYAARYYTLHEYTVASLVYYAMAGAEGFRCNWLPDALHRVDVVSRRMVGIFVRMLANFIKVSGDGGAANTLSTLDGLSFCCLALQAYIALHGEGLCPANREVWHMRLDSGAVDLYTLSIVTLTRLYKQLSTGPRASARGPLAQGVVIGTVAALLGLLGGEHPCGGALGFAPFNVPLDALGGGDAALSVEDGDPSADMSLAAGVQQDHDPLLFSGPSGTNPGEAAPRAAQPPAAADRRSPLLSTLVYNRVYSLAFVLQVHERHPFAPQALVSVLSSTLVVLTRLPLAGLLETLSRPQYGFPFLHHLVRASLLLLVRTSPALRAAGLCLVPVPLLYLALFAPWQALRSDARACIDMVFRGRDVAAEPLFISYLEDALRILRITPTVPGGSSRLCDGEFAAWLRPAAACAARRLFGAARPAAVSGPVLRLLARELDGLCAADCMLRRGVFALPALLPVGGAAAQEQALVDTVLRYGCAHGGRISLGDLAFLALCSYAHSKDTADAMIAFATGPSSALGDGPRSSVLLAAFVANPECYLAAIADRCMTDPVVSARLLAPLGRKYSVALLAGPGGSDASFYGDERAACTTMSTQVILPLRFFLQTYVELPPACLAQVRELSRGPRAREAAGTPDPHAEASAGQAPQSGGQGGGPSILSVLSPSAAGGSIDLPPDVARHIAAYKRLCALFSLVGLATIPVCLGLSFTQPAAAAPSEEPGGRPAQAAGHPAKQHVLLRTPQPVPHDFDDAVLNILSAICEFHDFPLYQKPGPQGVFRLRASSVMAAFRHSRPELGTLISKLLYSTNNFFYHSLGDPALGAARAASLAPLDATLAKARAHPSVGGSSAPKDVAECLRRIYAVVWPDAVVSYVDRLAFFVHGLVKDGGVGAGAGALTRSFGVSILLTHLSIMATFPDEKLNWAPSHALVSSLCSICDACVDICASGDEGSALVEQALECLKFGIRSRGALGKVAHSATRVAAVFPTYDISLTSGILVAICFSKGVALSTESKLLASACMYAHNNQTLCQALVRDMAGVDVSVAPEQVLAMITQSASATAVDGAVHTLLHGLSGPCAAAP